MTNKAELEATIENIRSKWRQAEQLVVDCDPRAIHLITDVEKLLEQHKELLHNHKYIVIAKDTKIIKNEFADSCICRNKEK